MKTQTETQMESLAPKVTTKKSSVTFNLLKSRAEKSLYEFGKQGWKVLEPHARFVDGVHVEAVCDHLQAVTEGRIGDLIINIPPGHAKSLLVAVFWPAWVWIHHPEASWLFASYRQELAERDSI